MKRKSLTQHIIQGLMARGYDKVRRSDSEVTLRKGKAQFIVQKCGKVLLVQNRVATEICY